jgi:uncharacterized membrane protein
MHNLSSGNPAVQAVSPQFSATLRPRRYLPPSGFRALLFNAAALSYLSVFVIFFLGMPWLAALWAFDIALCCGVYFWKYAPGRLTEEIVLASGSLSVTRTAKSGKAERFDFNPYWVRFEHKKDRLAEGELSLSSHGHRLSFGAFLSDREKAEFAAAFGAALAFQQNGELGVQSARG